MFASFPFFIGAIRPCARKLQNLGYGPVGGCRRGSAPIPSSQLRSPVRTVPGRLGGRAPGICARSSANGAACNGRSAKLQQNLARFRLYRHRSLQVNMRLSPFFKIYQIFNLKFLKFGKFCRLSNIYKNFAEFYKNC